MACASSVENSRKRWFSGEMESRGWNAQSVVEFLALKVQVVSVEVCKQVITESAGA
jgi:hypothetical protein